MYCFVRHSRQRKITTVQKHNSDGDDQHQQLCAKSTLRGRLRLCTFAGGFSHRNAFMSDRVRDRAVHGYVAMTTEPSVVVVVPSGFVVVVLAFPTQIPGSVMFENPFDIRDLNGEPASLFGNNLKDLANVIPLLLRDRLDPSFL